MKVLILSAVLAVTSATSAFADNGIVKTKSPHSVEVTAERYEQAAREKGIKVFPRFDHSEAAREYDQDLPPTVVLAVGNPKYGTKFMQTNPVAGIDFPPKAVVYQDAEGQVWLAYNSAEYLYGTIFERHGLDYPADDVEFYANVLKDLSNAAVESDP